MTIVVEGQHADPGSAETAPEVLVEVHGAENTAMRTYSRREATAPGAELDPSHFTGRATGVTLHRHGETNVTMVRFETGVRNHWHRHAGGQVLHVVDGSGYVQARGEEPRRIEPGDTVATGAGEEHWHGASGEGPFAHLAINVGETAWLEPS
jgi:quercetin dioxygenase-like cupin family protein